jgi:hypothetical protein
MARLSISIAAGKRIVEHFCKEENNHTKRGEKFGKDNHRKLSMDAYYRPRHRLTMWVMEEMEADETRSA